MNDYFEVKSDSQISPSLTHSFQQTYSPDLLMNLNYLYRAPFIFEDKISFWIDSSHLGLFQSQHSSFALSFQLACPINFLGTQLSHQFYSQRIPLAVFTAAVSFPFL